MGPSNPLPNCPTPTPGPPYLQISQLGGQQRRNWVESSELAHLPGRGVQISRFARNASLYRPGAARGWERGGGPGGRGGYRGGGSHAAPSAAPPAGPGKRGVCAGPRAHLRPRGERGARRAGAQGAAELPAEALGAGVSPLFPALGQSPKL